VRKDALDPVQEAMKSAVTVVVAVVTVWTAMVAVVTLVVSWLIMVWVSLVVLAFKSRVRMFGEVLGKAAFSAKAGLEFLAGVHGLGFGGAELGHQFGDELAGECCAVATIVTEGRGTQSKG